MRDQATEATIAAVAQKVSAGGGSLALVGGLTANEIAAFGGLLIAAIGLFVQFYYKRKSDRREEEIYRLRVRGELREDEP